MNLLAGVFVLVGGGLAAWTNRLRRELTVLRRRTTETQNCGVEKVAVLDEANAALRRKNQRLQTQCEEMQGELSALHYSISHDLRAPLRSIAGFSQALAEDHGSQLTGAAPDYLRRVQTAARHLDAMIEALLGLSRLRRAPLSCETVDLSAAAREITLELAATQPERRTECRVQPGLYAEGDRTQLTELLRHLLGNAWKFTAPRTVAHITFSATADGAGFEVRDNGIGFDPHYAGRLFGVFQRLHEASEFPGQGVGLATAQRIVRRHGGDIHATAEPDRGACVSFTLPAAGSGAPLSPESRSREEFPCDNRLFKSALTPLQPKPTVV